MKKLAVEDESLRNKVKRKILVTGATITSVSRQMKMSRNTITAIVNKLVECGELKVASETKNLKIYEDGRKSVDLSQLRAVPSGVENPCDREQPYTQHRTCSGNGGICDHSSRAVRVHASGCYECKIITNGSIEKALHDDDTGYTIGGWSDAITLKGGAQYHKGFIRVDNEDLKFKAYQNKKGDWTKLLIYPRPRYLYYKTALKESEGAMMRQIAIVKSVLAKSGWEVGHATHLGVMHFGDINPELLKYADKKTDFDDGRVHADDSIKGGEVEIYGDSKTAQHDINLLVELPERIDAIENAISRQTKILDKMVGNQEKVNTMLTHQQDSLTRMAESITRLSDMYEKQFAPRNTGYEGAYA